MSSAEVGLRFDPRIYISLTKWRKDYSDSSVAKSKVIWDSAMEFLHRRFRGLRVLGIPNEQAIYEFAKSKTKCQSNGRNFPKSASDFEVSLNIQTRAIDYYY